ncbi:hypothetical protein BH09BAC1_BH09BAC1_16480 [soil metagenome]
MLSKHITSFYKNNHFVVTGNLSDINHEESLVTPPTGGSSINWVLGHIVCYRCRSLETLGQPHPKGANLETLYEFNTLPNSETALSLGALKALYEETQQQLLSLLPRLDEGLEKEDRLVFYAYHETMHSGQFAILRRMLGKATGVKYK